MSDDRAGRASSAALPPGCQPYRSTKVFTEATVPPGLLGRHCTVPGTWALIRVLEGRMLYRVLEPPSERVLDPPSPPGLVEPGVPHQIAPLGELRFQVEFYRMKQAEAGAAAATSQPADGE
jgi:tellurite resistance-related uncharacterized protein